MSTQFEEYIPTKYFKIRGGDHPEQHVVGNSCDNLVALERQNPKNSILGKVPSINQPSSSAPKPCRSDPEENGAASLIPMNSGFKDIAIELLPHDDHEDFKETQYYGELRRHAFEQSTSSVAFDVDIY